MRSEPRTIIMPATTEEDLKRIAEFEEAMSRQIGWRFTMQPVKDKNGNEFRMVGWPMSRGDQAAVEMFMRRGKTASDTGKGKAMIKAGEMHKATPVAAMKAKGLEKTKEDKPVKKKAK